MREIKFRLWCSNNKEWERGEWLITPIGTLIEMKFGRSIDISNKTHLLSQYTGLKDKNGKEIYEGDIVEFVHSGEINASKVEYAIEKGFYITHKYKNYTYYYNICELDISYRKTTVIGNKYENPELLGE